jgi:hypothetical protein
VAAIGIAFYERQFVTVLLVYTCVYASLVIAREITLLHSSWTKAVLQAVSTAASISLALALSALILRWMSVRRAWLLVRTDKERYDVMWQSMMNSPASLEWLMLIQEQVENHILFSMPESNWL